MFKRLFAIAAVFIFFAAAVPAFAGQLFDAQTAVDDAVNNSGFYELRTKDGEDLNYASIPILSNYLKGDSYYGCLVYGQPHGDYKDGQYRYLGYTLFKPTPTTKEDYTNVAFPPDVSHTSYFEDQNWIREPWQNNDVKANYTIDFNNNLDGKNRYAQNILQGILIYYTDPNNANNYQVKGIIPETQDFWDNIQQYVHILAPPTEYAWGIGRMWRYGDSGQINYVTVPLLSGILLTENNLKAVSIDLGIPQDQLASPGSEYIATVVFENSSDQTFPETPVAVLHGEYRATLVDESGQALPVKTVGGKEIQVARFDKKGMNGAKRIFTCRWHPFNQLKDGLTGIINRDEIGTVYQEKTYEDNLVSAELSVEQINLAIGEFESGVPDDMAEVGQKYTASAIFTNVSIKTSITGAQVGAWNNGWPAVLYDVNGQTVDKLTLLPGESKVLCFDFHGQEGMNALTVAIDTPPLVNLYEETTEDDNAAVLDIPSVDPPVPPSNGDLRFQARSKGGNNQYGVYGLPVDRPENTAKLLDDVTAILEPPAPSPPKGELVSWSIASASLTYPNKSSRFAMIAPYPPEGTVTIDMNPGGHEATGYFEENWAMDGINADRGAPGVYNIIEGRVMAATPKKYTITATYTIEYEYKWQERKRKCSTGSDGKKHCHTYYVTRYGSGTSSGTASGKLLVDGVGSAVFSQ